MLVKSYSQRFLAIRDAGVRGDRNGWNGLNGWR
jgi:hypothetical protein